MFREFWEDWGFAILAGCVALVVFVLVPMLALGGIQW